MHSFNSHLPVLSDSERDMKKELVVLNDQLSDLESTITQVQMKTEYQRKEIQPEESARKKSITLSVSQKKCIHSVLKEQSEHITEMVKKINDIRTHVNF